ncbi:MAG: hypothetical protein HeimC3_44980 [Candidatus Heimdallarchaeota archaeon LC_3]|nr:MAG: hypothetical protein HeimC3_44980 [Candidatus Heimdallarchaeota archaeon LC_3]
MPNFQHYWGISRLKQLLRQGWVNNVPISAIESVADHSFAVGYFSYIFSLWENDLRSKKKQDLLKLEASKYCVAGLFHDIAESYYIDFDKNVIDLVPEAKSLKKTAETRGFNKILEFWAKKNRNISKNMEKLFIENLDQESKLFIEVIDKIELHWQTLTYYMNNWISLSNAQPFITSTYEFIKKNQEKFNFIENLLKEKLIFENLQNVIDIKK